MGSRFLSGASASLASRSVSVLILYSFTTSFSGVVFLCLYVNVSTFNLFFMPGVSLARPSKDDFDRIYSFFSVLDALYASRWDFSNAWISWDDDDPDKQELLRLRRMLAAEECCDEDDVDNRLVFEAFVRSRISRMCGAWERVVLSSETLLDYVCDLSSDTVDLHPVVSRALEDAILGE